jgi:hypothetical protein
MTDYAGYAEPVPNTEAQTAFHQATEAAWEEERTWPIWRVTLSGDPVEWVPRADERYWMQQDPTDPRTAWVPRPAEELPDDAELSEQGHVVRTATCVILCHARTEDHAKMLAMRDNPTYHTVETVETVENVES